MGATKKDRRINAVLSVLLAYSVRSMAVSGIHDLDELLKD